MPGIDDAPNSTGANEPSLRDDLASAFDAPVDPGAPPVDDGGAPLVDPNAAPHIDGAGRVRDPVTKRFVKAPDGTQQPVPDQPQPGQEQQPIQGQEALTPPPSFSPTAKAEWAKVPPSVQQAIAKREKEVDAGFKKYAGLDQFVQQAQQSGTTLPEALGRYVAAEQLLEREPIKGILWLCNNYGISPLQLVQAVGGQQPQPQPQPQPNGQQPAPGQQPYPGFDIRQQLDPVLKQVNELRQIVYGSQQEKVLGEVDAFFRDTKAHPYVENVAEEMAKILQSGLKTTLQEAYEAACWNNTEVRGLLINDITSAQTADQANKAKQVADQARRAGQSITGGPAVTPAPGAPETDNLREQLQGAFAAQRVT